MANMDSWLFHREVTWYKVPSNCMRRVQIILEGYQRNIVNQELTPDDPGLVARKKRPSQRAFFTGYISWSNQNL
jgi:hypothetical protein